MIAASLGEGRTLPLGPKGPLRALVPHRESRPLEVTTHKHIGPCELADNENPSDMHSRGRACDALWPIVKDPL